MDLYELRELFVDNSQLVVIYNISEDADVVFQGEFSDLPEELETCEICSIDNIYKGTDGYVGINIEV